MREILFRGLHQRKGEKIKLDGTPTESIWVYGGIYPGNGCRSLITTLDTVEKYPVYSETVGQFTGLYDKNNNRIWEGDCVKDKFDTVCIVSFCESWGSFCAKVIYGIGEEGNRCELPSHSNSFIGSNWREWEVIGNIYEDYENLNSKIEHIT